MNTADLQQQIDDRDALVAALTDQLEKAAEQLDRMQRSGAISSQLRPLSPADEPSEHAGHVGHADQLGQDVEYLVQQWDASQLAAGIGRIESQLDDLRSLMHSGAIASPSINHGNQPSGSQQHNDPAGDATIVDRESDLLASIQEVLNRGSNAIPETELDSSQDEATAGQAGSNRDDDGSAEESALDHQSDPSDQTAAADGFVLSELPEPPEPIEFEVATAEDLHVAIKQRDAFIRQILEQFRTLHRQQCVQPPPDWEMLNNTPKRSIAYIEKLERQLEEQSRVSEVSMSIERARLSRESTQLEMAWIELKKKIKQKGLDPDDFESLGDQGQTKKSANKEPARADKWLSMLRIKD